MEDVAGQDGWTESPGQWRRVGGKGGPEGKQQVPGEVSTGWRVDGPEAGRDKAKTRPHRITVPDCGWRSGTKAAFENHTQANSKARRPWELSKPRVLSLASEMLNKQEVARK